MVSAHNSPNHDPGVETEQKFSGQWVTLTLPNVARIQDSLGRGELEIASSKFEDDLPRPLTELELYVAQNEDTTLDNLSARVEFDLNLLPNIPEFNGSEWWQHKIVDAVTAKTLESINSDEYHSLPHEAAVSYIVVDDIHTLRISASTVLSRCTISAELIETDGVERQLGIEPAADRGTSLKNTPFTAIQTAIQSMVHATDEVMNWSRIPYSAKKVLHRTVHLVEDTEPVSQNPQFIAPDLTPADTMHELEMQTTEHNPFDFIGGATEAKRRLEEMALTFQHKELAEKYDITANHFLLYGPGGTGKTSLAKAFAAHIGADLQEHNSTDITSKWVGDSGKQMMMVFNRARRTNEETGRPVVIFLDEFDSLAPKGRSGTSERQDIKNIIKSQITSISETHPQIILATASNEDIGNFDEALLRAGRIEGIYVPKPTLAERPDVWKAVMLQSLERFGSMDLDNDSAEVPFQHDPYDIEIDYQVLAAMTDEMTGADFKKILEIARRRMFLSAIATGNPGLISQRDIEAVIRGYTPTN